LYKYGGVGSGGGGGTSSGSTSGWSIIATLNSQSLDNEKLILKNGVGQYSLNVKISKPQGGTYSLQYRIGNRAASNRYVLS
jgi:hypothetical protein